MKNKIVLSLVFLVFLGGAVIFLPHSSWASWMQSDSGDLNSRILLIRQRIAELTKQLQGMGTSNNNSTSQSASVNNNQTVLPAKIMMTDYFPVRNMSRLYRLADGSVYLKHVIEKVDPYASFVPTKPGSVHYVLHDYFKMVVDAYDSSAKVVHSGDYQDANHDEAPYYGDTWHLRNDLDGGVFEAADSFAQTDANGKPAKCDKPCYGRLYQYNEQAIGHGRPSGDTVGEAAYIQDPIKMWMSPDSGVTPFSYIPNSTAFSSIQVIDKLDSYTPEYGSKDGVFRKGGGQTYNNVIVALFSHGWDTSVNEPACTNMPAGYEHKKGRLSFWQKVWLAPGIGWIKIENLYYEGWCSGTLAPTAATPASNWVAYLDKVTFEGSGNLANGKVCVNNADCLSKNCNYGVCCGAGQCGYGDGSATYPRVCLASGETRSNPWGDVICRAGVSKIVLNGKGCDAASLGTGGVGLACDQGSCVKNYCVLGGKISNASACSSNGQCISGNCSYGNCCNAGQCGWGDDVNGVRQCVANGGKKANQWLNGVCRNGVWKTITNGVGCLTWGCDNSTDKCVNNICSGGAAQVCVPKTCSGLGYSCGTATDGCGNTLNCGVCAAGLTCSTGVCKAGDNCVKLADLGGYLKYDPIIANKNGTLVVAGVGGGDDVWINEFNTSSNTVGGWYNLGGQTYNRNMNLYFSDPEKRLYLQVIGLNNKVWYRSTVEGKVAANWTDWVGTYQTAISATGNSLILNGVTYRAARQTDGTVRIEKCDGGVMFGWYGGTLDSGNAGSNCDNQCVNGQKCVNNKCEPIWYQ